MSISKRVSIAWDGFTPYEDTDTLVLTGRTYFVDVRVKKGSNPTALDWAIAGTRSSTPGARPGESLCKWRRLIDSRTSDGGVDEGVVFPDPSDPTKTMETGSMYNPITDRVEPYEEVWLDTVPSPGTQVAFLEKEDGAGFIAIVGELRLGVGSRYAWRTEGGNVVYEVGLTEGMQIDLGEEVEEGSKVGSWIVREFWKT
ncbi:hypothetical protein BJ322DRAFT_1076307 [Thelephora terrestris]|uniref:Protein HRI1 n=1 Tax=Thelephora terrestris TaxID=56493 RepID=A0A9P6L4X5_9AGAM|nr:hypothetical protein BJ322DRAFT_1076307 [Thelephora terrestris]